jgi:hypothetical protein
MIDYASKRYLKHKKGAVAAAPDTQPPPSKRKELQRYDT